MCNCSTNQEENMNQSDLMKYGIAAGILFAGYKYGNGMVKAASVAVAAVIVAKRVPYINQVM